MFNYVNGIINYSGVELYFIFQSKLKRVILCFVDYLFSLKGGIVESDCFFFVRKMSWENGGFCKKDFTGWMWDCFKQLIFFF